MKKVLYVILALVVLYLILGFFGPKRIVVARNTVVNKPAEEVKQKLGDFKFFHDRWSPWTEKDPNMKNTYEGTPATVGHLYTWSGNKEVGEGSMRIIKMEGDTLKEELTFKGEGTSTVNLVAQDKGNNTTAVTWQMVMDVGYIFRPIMLFMNMDKMMGPDFEKGLANFKTVVESSSNETQTAATTYEVKEIEWPEVNYIGTKKESVGINDVPAYLGKHLPALFADLGKNKIQPLSPPSGLYWNYNEAEAKMDMAAAIKVENGKKMKGYENYNPPASKVLHVVYYGPYDKMQPAHEAIMKHMKEKGQTHVLAIEEYATDPGLEKDSTKWITNVYYVLK